MLFYIPFHSGSYTEAPHIDCRSRRKNKQLRPPQSTAGSGAFWVDGRTDLRNVCDGVKSLFSNSPDAGILICTILSKQRLSTCNRPTGHFLEQWTTRTLEQLHVQTCLRREAGPSKPELQSPGTSRTRLRGTAGGAQKQVKARSQFDVPDSRMLYIICYYIIGYCHTMICHIVVYYRIPW